MSSAVGHVRERRPGRWELRVFAGRDPLTGRKKYATTTVDAASEREAKRKLVVFAASVIVEGAPSADLTVGELIERWYRFAAPRMVPKGRAETRSIIDTRLVPLADVKLSRLTGPTGTAILDDLYVALRARGRRCRLRQRCEATPCPHGGGGPLSAASVVRTHVVIHAALEQAVKWGLASRNPAEHASPGEADADEVDPPAPEDVLRLFELAEREDPELVVLLVLTATTGARRGAALALRWDDVDLETGVVKFGHVLSIGPDGVERVERGRGRRNRKGGKQRVPLDPAVLAIVLAHRARCEARAALAGVELPTDGYVFAADGVGHVPWRPDSTTRRVRRIRDAVGLKGKPIHDLRHFVVTYLLASGVDLATVKELVGHAASSRTTLDVYGHALTSKTRAATGILARLLELGGAGGPTDPAGPGADVIPFRRSS